METESIDGSGITYGDGAIMGRIVPDRANDPPVHGLDIKNGVLWYRGANKGWICSLI